MMSASILACNGLRFVEKAVILFNAHAFVVPNFKRPIDDPQGCTHIFEYTLETTSCVDNENHNHAGRENDIIHENFHKMFHMCFVSNSRDKKLC